MTPTENLLHIERIKKLKYEYWRACDAKDPQGFRRCFTKHGSSIDYGALGVTDADGMVEVFRRIALQKDESGHRILDMHHGFHPDITLIGDTEATGRCILPQ